MDSFLSLRSLGVLLYSVLQASEHMPGNIDCCGLRNGLPQLAHSAFGRHMASKTAAALSLVKVIIKVRYVLWE